MERLIELQKKILGQRQDPLTSIELKELLLKTHKNAEFILYVLTALKTQSIDPGIFLVQAINCCRSQDDLLYIALALRCRADPNTYISAPKIGTIHVIGYTYRVMREHNVDPEVIDLAVLLLYASGSLPAKTIFDPKGGAISEDTVSMTRISILEWLSEQGIETFLITIQQDLATISDATSCQVGLLLDRPDLMRSCTFNIEDAIGYHSNNLLALLPACDDCLSISLVNLNVESFRKYVMMGKLPNYLVINSMGLKLRHYHKAGLKVAYTAIKDMYLASIKHGTTIDKEQFGMLMTVSSELGTEIQKAYETPYWKKACSLTTTPATARLLRLAYSLEIDPSTNKDLLCEKLAEMSAAEPERLKSAAVARQRLRVMTEHTSPIDYIRTVGAGSTGGIAGPVDPIGAGCKNKTMMNTDPYEYNDIDLASYKDNQGTVWCFTADNFRDLLTEKRNLYTLEPLPESFLKTLECHLAKLKILGMSEEPITVTKAIGNLKEKDTIDDSETEEYVRAFEQTLVLHGVDPVNVRKLSRKQLGELISIFVGDTEHFDLLTPSHAYITFCRVSRVGVLNSTDQGDSFFYALKAALIDVMP